MKPHLIIVRIQRYLLYAYVFSIHFETWDPFNTGISFFNTKLTISLYLISTILAPHVFFNLKKIGQFVLPLILIFILQTLISYININTNSNEYFDFITFLNILMLIAIANHSIRSPRIKYGIVKSYVAGGILMTIFFFLNINTNHSWEGRSTIFEFNQNQLAVNLAMLLVFLIWPFFGKKKFSVNIMTLFSFLFIPFVLFFLMKTGSRSGILVFLLALLGMLLLKQYQSIQTKAISIILSSIVLLGVILIFMSNALIFERFSASINEGDMSGRDVRWISVYNIILESPIFGIGKTGYTLRIEESLGFFSSPHNVLLETAAYTGIIGLIILMYFFYKLFKASFFIYKLTKNHIALVLMSPIIILTLFGHTFGSKMVYLIFAFVISSFYKINRRYLLSLRKKKRDLKLINKIN